MAVPFRADALSPVGPASSAARKPDEGNKLLGLNDDPETIERAAQAARALRDNLQDALELSPDEDYATELDELVERAVRLRDLLREIADLRTELPSNDEL